MSKIFKPRRGTSTTMSTTKASTVLASGEMFFELSSSGLGQPGVGIKMGDGTTAYSSLPYFIKSVNLASDTITPATNSQTTSTAALNDVTSGKTIPQLIGALKKAISLTKTEVTTTIDDRTPFKLAIQNNTYGYKTTSGTFVAFRGDSTDIYTYASGSTGGTVDMGARNNYRYVNAQNVYAKGKSDGVTTHTGTYTLTWDSDFGKTKDLGTNHTYRYISVPSKPTGEISITNLPFSNKTVSGSTSLGTNFVSGTYYFMASAVPANNATQSGVLSASITGGEFIVRKIMMDSTAAGSAGAYIIKATSSTISVHCYNWCTLFCIGLVK